MDAGKKQIKTENNLNKIFYNFFLFEKFKINLFYPKILNFLNEFYVEESKMTFIYLIHIKLTN